MGKTVTKRFWKRVRKSTKTDETIIAVKCPAYVPVPRSPSLSSLTLLGAQFIRFYTSHSVPLNAIQVQKNAICILFDSCPVHLSNLTKVVLLLGWLTSLFVWLELHYTRPKCQLFKMRRYTIETFAKWIPPLLPRAASNAFIFLAYRSIFSLHPIPNSGTVLRQCSVDRKSVV